MAELFHRWRGCLCLFVIADYFEELFAIRREVLINDPAIGKFRNDIARVLSGAVNPFTRSQSAGLSAESRAPIAVRRE